MIQNRAIELGYSQSEMTALLHLVISHHGKAELGAAVEPNCIEAQILTSLDGLDSRMEIYREAVKHVEKGKFSEFVRPLNKAVYRA